MYGQFPMTSNIPTSAVGRPDQNRDSDWQGNLDSGPEVDRLVAVLRVRISPACSMTILRQQLVARLGGPGGEASLE